MFNNLKHKIWTNKANSRIGHQSCENMWKSADEHQKGLMKNHNFKTSGYGRYVVWNGKYHSATGRDFCKYYCLKKGGAINDEI